MIYTDNLFAVLAASLACFFLSACKSTDDQHIRSEKKHALIEGISKSEAERKQMIQLAEKGNVQAASELAEHFLLVEQNYDLAKYWFHKAAIFGGPHEKEVYKSLLETLKEK